MNPKSFYPEKYTDKLNISYYLFQKVIIFLSNNIFKYMFFM